MKNLLFFLLILLGCSASSENKKPNLVVAIVIDQMRYDFLENLSHRYSDNGFNRLVNDGFNCKNNLR